MATNSAAAPVGFYFDFISPFGWIAAERIGGLCRAHGRTVDWNPFLLKATVVEAMGLPPVLETPLKGPYLLRDLKRLIRLYGLALSPAARFTFSSLTACRAVTWAKAGHAGAVEALVLALYRRHWSDGDDISRRDVVLDVAAGIGVDVSALDAGLDDPAIKQAFRASVDWTLELGVFGSPTTIVDGEPFWGADRLDQAAEWMRTGGW